MADVTLLPSIPEQVWLVAALRWRILRNGLRKKNNRLDLIGLVLAGIFAGSLVIGLSFAFFSGTYFLLSRGYLERLAWLFWGIFLFWQVVALFLAGFGAKFEFRTLLRFPLSLRAFYIIGLAYGFADFSAVASICWLISMIAGVAAAKHRILSGMLLISFVFVLLNVTLERLVGSWVERLIARRRTREVLLGLFVLSMICLNFIQPLLEKYGGSARPMIQHLMPYLAWLPPSLAGNALAAAAGAQVPGFFLDFSFLLIYFVLFSTLLCRRFAKQYRSEELSETNSPERAIARSLVSARSRPDRRGLLSPQVAAVIHKEFRYLTRNGFSLFALLIPPLVALAFSMNFAGRNPTIGGKGISPDTFFPAMAGYLILILMAPAYNSFAYEGRGIQTYFTAPLRFRDVFLGKNLMLVCVLMVEIVLSLAMLAWRAGLPSRHLLVATCAGIAFTIAGQLTIANWSSLSFPRKMEFGQMRGQRQSGMAAVIAFAFQILLGGISAVILLTGKVTGNPWLPAEAFLVLAAAAVGGYFASLDALTKLAETKKEVLIEALCR